MFCPYLSKKMRIFKNSSCMKHGGVYRIKHFYNIFWTNLPLKYDLYENLTKIAHLSQYFASISTKKRTCKKSRVIWNTRVYTGPDEVKTFFQQAILVKSDHWGDYDLTLRKNGSKTAHFWQYFAHISSKKRRWKKNRVGCTDWGYTGSDYQNNKFSATFVPRRYRWSEGVIEREGEGDITRFVPRTLIHQM